MMSQLELRRIIYLSCLSGALTLGSPPLAAEEIPKVRTVAELQSEAAQVSGAESLRGQSALVKVIAQPERSPTAQAPTDDDDIDITVTGTRTPRLLQDSPSSITIFNRQEIQQNLITTPRELIRYEPNLSTNNDPSRGFRNFNIRGIEGNRILFQVDGIRLPSVQDIIIDNGRDFVDLGTLRRVEVLRGGGSALFGSDALGGVLSFQTIDPKDLLNLVGKDEYFELGAGYNSANSGFSGSAIAAWRYGNVEGLFSYVRRDFRELQRNGDSRFIDRQVGNSNAYLGKLVFPIDQFSSLKFTGEVLNRSTETNFAIANLRDGAMSNLTTDFRAGLRTNRTRVSLNYDFENPNSEFIQLVKLLVYYQDSQTPETTVELRRANAAATAATLRRDGVNDFLDRIAGIDLQLQSNFATGEALHKLTYGTELSWQRNERPRDRFQTNLTTGVVANQATSFIPDLFPTKDFPDSNTFRLGVYVQDEITWGAVSIIPGVRLDVYTLTTFADADFLRNGAPPPVDFSSTAVSPRLGLVWKATPDFSIYGQYSRGFRAPSYDEINSGFANALFQYRVIPNPELRAETSDNFEIGVRGSFPQGKFSLVGFYNLYDNFILSNQIVNVPPEPPFTLTFQALNVQRARIYGLEASGEYRFSPAEDGFSVLASLGFAVGDDLNTSEPLNTIDPLKVVAGLRYRAPENQWGASLLATYVGAPRTAADSLQLVPTEYITVDLTGYYNFSSQVTLNLGIFNLFNAKYFENADLRNAALVSTNAADVARIDRFAQPGINVAASLVWKF
ncbi:MAG: TonB-dependent hemoglobin/transferrin/lactoferrin family receptor [Oscillatoriales cyanobacterium SM2_2_1]|nr:TonB-dependent hemoglobin/transferrin/lactoferrin family receptor [Oscillatoriales cyanobacterium SM2_2_1]